MHFNQPGDFETINPKDAHIRTEEYALFRTARIGEWIDEFGIEVIGMRPLRDELRAGATLSAARATRTRKETPMYIVGEEEIDAVAQVIRERRAVPLRHRQRVRPLRGSATPSYLGVKHFALAASGTQRARRRDDRASASARATRC